MKIRSAIHYPNSRVTNINTMKAALLLWDEYHVIGPWSGFDPQHEGEVKEAWKLIGKVTVPQLAEQRRAHGDIVEFLKGQPQLDPRFVLRSRVDAPQSDIYEMYPQKLLGETWWELEEAGLTGDLLPSADRPMSSWGGLLVMAKLADACAGRVFARVTDRTDAYRAIATETKSSDLRHGQDAAVTVPILLTLIEASSIPLENLLRFRESERNATLRHNLLDVVVDHVQDLQTTDSANQVRELQRQFEREMRQNLADLKDALRFNRIKFATSASVLTLATGAFAAAAALQSGPLQIGHALGAAATAGLGLKQIFDFFGTGLDLSDKQRTTLAKNPMAYMHLLSKQGYGR